MVREQQNIINKTLYITDDRYTIWVQSISVSITVINITDSELSLTYCVADFDGSKYEIKNRNIFNTIFIRAAKKRPQLIRDLIKFHSESRKGSDLFDNVLFNTSGLKRKINVYRKKTINKVKSKLLT
jgi:hypothetical protein